jgi:hypothetical protein
VYIGACVLVPRFAVYVALEGDDVEAFWITIDLEADADLSGD